MATFGRDLTPTQRAALGCWFNRRTRTYEPPTENAIYRVLKAVPVLEFQLAVWAWQKARLGALDGDAVVFDGKAVRGSQGTQLVNAINGQSGRWPARATRFPPAKPCWTAWTWRAPSP